MREDPPFFQVLHDTVGLVHGILERLMPAKLEGPRRMSAEMSIAVTRLLHMHSKQKLHIVVPDQL